MDKKVLICDDECLFGFSFTKRLEVLGYQVVGFTQRGKHALDLAREERPDIVLMDVRIKNNPEEGIEYGTKIYNDLNIPVLYVTGSGNSTTIEKMEKSGLGKYILKPINNSKLRKGIIATFAAQKKKLGVLRGSVTDFTGDLSTIKKKNG